MGIRDRVARLLTRNVNAGGRGGQTARVDPSTLTRTGGYSSPYWTLNADRQNLELTYIYRGVYLIADLVATLPFEAERLEPVDASIPREARTWRRLERQPSIVRQPDPLELQSVTMRRLATDLMLRGNAYVIVTLRDPDTRRPVDAFIPSPSDMFVTWNAGRTRRVYRWRGDELNPRDVYHIRFMELPDEPLGLGPLQTSPVFINGARAVDEFARRLFSDGAIPGGTLETAEMLTDEEAGDLKAQWLESHAGVGRDVAVLDGGASYKPVGLKPEEGQMIETRGMNVAHVAALLGLDPFLLAHVVPGSSLVYQNVQDLFRHLLRTTLEPTYLSKIENVFTDMLPAGTRARFNPDEFLRTDTQRRFDAYQTGIDSGVLTVNEARQIEGLPPRAPDGPRLEVADELETAVNQEAEI